MTLAQGVSTRVTVKQYATGVIQSNTQPVSATDPAATGGQILRRVSSTLDFVKDTYQSNEVRSDEQIADFRHGVGRVSGNIVGGEFSPGTYFDLIESAFRTTRVGAIAKTNTEFTSVAADGPTSKFTFGGGSPVTEGLRVGHIIRFTNLSETLNNSKNFVILSMGGTSLRELTVWPAPTTMGADSAFNVTTVGKTVFPLTTGHVSRKWAVEVYHSDIDMARFFTECRIGGVSFNLPAQGLATIDFSVMGRDMELLQGANAPFFTAPTAATTTGIFAAVNGAFFLGGTRQGVITGIGINNNRNPTSNAVVGQPYVPEIFLGRNNCTGQFSGFLEDFTYVSAFKDETELTAIMYLTTTSAVNSPAVVITMPRIKLGNCQIGVAGEEGVPVSASFQMLKYETAVATAGIENTTMMVADSEIV